jgi:hypothetical protein
MRFVSQTVGDSGPLIAHACTSAKHRPARLFDRPLLVRSRAQPDDDLAGDTGCCRGRPGAVQASIWDVCATDRWGTRVRSWVPRRLSILRGDAAVSRQQRLSARATTVSTSKDCQHDALSRGCSPIRLAELKGAVMYSRTARVSTEAGSRTITTPARGYEVLRDPAINKGSAFDREIGNFQRT